MIEKINIGQNKCQIATSVGNNFIDGISLSFIYIYIYIYIYISSRETQDHHLTFFTKQYLSYIGIVEQFVSSRYFVVTGSLTTSNFLSQFSIFNFQLATPNLRFVSASGNSQFAEAFGHF
jgi:hypothetical protein